MPAESPELLDLFGKASRTCNAKWPPWQMLLTVAGAAAAQNGGPLRSPACLRALDALQAEARARRTCR